MLFILECYDWNEQPQFCTDQNAGKQICSNLADKITSNDNLTYTMFYKPCIEAIVLPSSTLLTQHMCTVLPCDYFEGAFYITTDRNEKNVHVLMYDSIGIVKIFIEVVQLRHHKSFEGGTQLYQQTYNHLYRKPWDNTSQFTYDN